MKRSKQIDIWLKGKDEFKTKEFKKVFGLHPGPYFVKKSKRGKKWIKLRGVYKRKKIAKKRNQTKNEKIITNTLFEMAQRIERIEIGINDLLEGRKWAKYNKLKKKHRGKLPKVEDKEAWMDKMAKDMNTTKNVIRGIFSELKDTKTVSLNNIMKQVDVDIARITTVISKYYKQIEEYTGLKIKMTYFAIRGE